MPSPACPCTNPVGSGRGGEGGGGFCVWRRPWLEEAPALDSAPTSWTQAPSCYWNFISTVPSPICWNSPLPSSAWTIWSLLALVSLWCHTLKFSWVTRWVLTRDKFISRFPSSYSPPLYTWKKHCWPHLDHHQKWGNTFWNASQRSRSCLMFIWEAKYFMTSFVILWDSAKAPKVGDKDSSNLIQSYHIC